MSAPLRASFVSKGRIPHFLVQVNPQYFLNPTSEDIISRYAGVVPENNLANFSCFAGFSAIAPFIRPIFPALRISILKASDPRCGRVGQLTDLMTACPKYDRGTLCFCRRTGEIRGKRCSV
jgi:hypothetical protein